VFLLISVDILQLELLALVLFALPDRLSGLLSEPLPNRWDIGAEELDRFYVVVC
jgi:hypothetical protein